MFACGDVVEIRPIDARYVGMPAFVALFDGGKYAHRICNISYGTIATVIGLSVSQTGDPEDDKPLLDLLLPDGSIVQSEAKRWTRV